MAPFDSRESGDNLEAVCFDLDGVIVDSEPVHYEADRLALAAYDVPFTYENKIKNYIGRTVKGTMFDLARAHQISDPDALLKERQAIFLELIGTQLELRVGVLDLLLELFDRHLPCVLVTSGSRWYIDKVFERFELGPFFAGVITVEDVSLHKPHPEPYLAGANLVEVLPEFCLAVEDSTAGVASAKSAGMYTIAAPSEMTRGSDLSKADARIESFDELDLKKLDDLFGAK